MEEEDFQEVILETVKKVFNFQCSAKVELKDSETFEEGEEWGGQGQTDVTSMTYLSAEDVNCSVGICFSKPSYYKYISAMFGEEVTELDDQATDASGEFLNMIMGNIKAKYYEVNKKDIESTFPMSFFGRPSIFKIDSDVKLKVYPMESHLGPVFAIISFGKEPIMPWSQDFF